jgi:hypothetical protein
LHFRGISTRILAVAWWFFTLIIISTYTANLAAALSTKSVVWSFETAEQLASQNKIKYGAKKKGSTLDFFKVSAVILDRNNGRNKNNILEYI